MVVHGIDRPLDELTEQSYRRSSISRRTSSRAEPYSRGAGKSDGKRGGGLVCHSALAEQLKEMQRTMTIDPDDWRAYCDEHGYPEGNNPRNSYDPHRYEDGFLRRAIADLLLAGCGTSRGSGSRNFGGKGERRQQSSGRSSWRDNSGLSLAEEMKALQREGTISADDWRAFCDENGDGSYDPHRYDADFLKAAIAELSGEGAGNVHTSNLVEDIKEWQRSDMDNTEEWRRYCDDYGNGSYDPNRYDPDFLKKALRELRGGSVADHNGRSHGRGSEWTTGAVSSGGRLSDRVKELQRSSKRHTEAWREYCLSAGDGSFDPHRYEANFLRAWLDEMEEATDGDK